MHTTIKMFADDTKLFTKVSRDQMAQELQEDIHRPDKWAEKWQLTFNQTNVGLCIWCEKSAEELRNYQEGRK